MSPEGPLDKYASASTALLSAGRSGILPLYLNTTPDTSTWSCRFSPPPGRFSTTSIPRLRSAFASPTPESIRSFGLLMAPAARITSFSAAVSFTAPSVISLTPAPPLLLRGGQHRIAVRECPRPRRARCPPAIVAWRAAGSEQGVDAAGAAKPMTKGHVECAIFHARRRGDGQVVVEPPADIVKPD